MQSRYRTSKPSKSRLIPLHIQTLIVTSIITSDLFTFLIGEKRQAIIVHSAAVSARSKALHALLHNGMIETQMRTATLDDVEVEDFLRFCQFAYTGDYTVPPCTRDDEGIEPAPDDIPEPPPAIEEDTWAPKTKKQRRITPSISFISDHPSDASSVWAVDLKILRSTFENKRYCAIHPREKLLDSCEPTSNTAASQNFTPVFLAHCRLYVFADKYGVKSLRKLALHKIHRTLLTFELYPQRVQDLVELVRFAFMDRNTYSGGADELRALVTLYMASRVDKLKGSEPFVDLLEDGGPFVRNFWLLLRNDLDWAK